MALAIRLARGGAKKRPYYRIVVADSRNAARRPLHREARHLQSAAGEGFARAGEARRRAHLALASVGAQPSDRVLRFLDAAGIRERTARNNPQKAEPGEKAKERSSSARRRRPRPPRPPSAAGRSRGRNRRGSRGSHRRADRRPSRSSRRSPSRPRRSSREAAADADRPKSRGRGSCRAEARSCRRRAGRREAAAEEACRGHGRTARRDRGSGGGSGRGAARRGGCRRASTKRVAEAEAPRADEADASSWRVAEAPAEGADDVLRRPRIRPRPKRSPRPRNPGVHALDELGRTVLWEIPTPSAGDVEAR